MHEVVTNKNVHVDKYLIRLVWSYMAFLTLLNCDEERVKKRYWLSALPKYITHFLVLYRLLYLAYVTGNKEKSRLLFLLKQAVVMECKNGGSDINEGSSVDC